MGAIDFILNAVALLVWLSWRSFGFDPLVKSSPATLVGTLKRAEPKQLRAWQVGTLLCAIIVLRALLYWLVGAPVDWTPKLNLEFVVLPFRSDSFRAALAYSCLSFIRALLVLYFWLIAMALINRNCKEPDPIQKLVRLHLGPAARWPWPLQVMLPILIVVALWIGLHPMLLYLGVSTPAHSNAHLVGQGSLIGLALLLSLKYLLPTMLLLHLVASYVYLGPSPFWQFVATTSTNVAAPLRRLPLRLARVDFTPVLAAVLILGILHWLPGAILARIAATNLSTWPQ